ncbi:MAG: hypothetical protein JO261_13540 [Alphaproteobacteria bacterium]|nr:hypothetical protein [Alphaproteobacteria bacterium]MBV9694715.1 hypothetical protein [Alphaproteobacteria bacterium]
MSETGIVTRTNRKSSVPLVEGIIGGGMLALILGGVLLPGLGTVVEGAIAVIGAGLGAATAIAMRK